MKIIKLLIVLSFILSVSGCKDNKIIDISTTTTTTITSTNQAETTRKPASPNEFPKNLPFSAEDIAVELEANTSYSDGYKFRGLDFKEADEVPRDKIYLFFYENKMLNGNDNNGLKFHYMQYAVQNKNDEKSLIFNIPVKIEMDYLKIKFNVDDDYTKSQDYNKSKNTFIHNVYTNEFGEFHYLIYIKNTKKISGNKYSIEYDIYPPPGGGDSDEKLLTRKIVVEIKNKNYKYLSAESINNIKG